MIKKILHISPDFNYSCGVSKLVFLTLSYFDNNPGYKTYFVTNGGDSLDRLKLLKNTEVIQKPFSRGIRNILHYNSFKNSVRKFCKENEIQIIHTYHRFPELIAVKAAKDLNIKTVTSALSYVEGYRGFSFQSDKIICEVDYIKNMLVNNFNIPENKIIKMYLPAEHFDTITEKGKKELKRFLSINENQTVLLFIGKISYKKGFDKLLEAYKAVHSKNKNTILIMCGNIEADDFGKIRNRLDVPVILIPPKQDYYKLYQIADIVILPSRVDPFPFVMIEAGLNHKPFIGGNTGGITEFIDHNVDGLLVNPEDENDLAEKITSLLDNEIKAKELDGNLYKKVREKCSHNIYFNKLETVYKSLFN